MLRFRGLEGADLFPRETRPEHTRRFLRQLSGDGDELAGGDSNSFHGEIFVACRGLRASSRRAPARFSMVPKIHAMATIKIDSQNPGLVSRSVSMF